MTTHHPDEQWLNDFAAGNLPLAYALCVSTHLSYCPSCSARLRELNSLGGALLETLQPEPVQDALLTQLLEQLDDNPQAAAAERQSASAHDNEFPHAVSKLMTKPSMDELDWVRLGKSLRFSRLSTGDTVHETALYRIAPGGKIANHGHNSTEITVVLKGSFSDADGIYHKGDFVLRDATSQHSPNATQDAECVCLSVLEAPVAFTGWRSLLNPLLSVKPQ